MSVLSNMTPPEADGLGASVGTGQTFVPPGTWTWLGVLTCAALVAVLYRDSLADMVRVWSLDENYGHGFFVPLISGYLIWERRRDVAARAGRGVWWGVAGVVAALGLYFLGEFTTIYALLHLSFWLMLVSLSLAALGFAGVGAIMFPLGYLLTMIPLPQFLYQALSAKLQLISSALGVGCLQLVGVTAFREGNVIDLGPVQLQVIEACSGLRYMFPLASLALLCAYLFRAPLWKRALVFLSSFPISILLNGFRIGIIGLLVDLYGEGMAEGFAHFFEGWLIFVVSLILLFVEIWVLSRVGRTGQRRSLSALLGLRDRAGGPEPTVGADGKRRGGARLAPAFIVAVALLLPATVVSARGVAGEEAHPARRAFLDFPMRLRDWAGTPLVMEQAYMDTLKFDDYLLADYRRDGDIPVNLYVAYYRSQKKGRSAHSPRTCIPGGGWEITSIEDRALGGAGPITVNRVAIQKDDQRQIVLYWFQQRGRIVANEYLVKWYLLWDAVTKQRTDGALVRLTTALGPGEAEAAGERRLVAFAEALRPLLGTYVPD
jgi:exosortase D (VPLPA-CTERM-specific)